MGRAGRPAIQDDEIKAILGFGGGLRLDGSGYRTGVLNTFAEYAKRRNAQLILMNMRVRSGDDLKAIAGHGGGASSSSSGTTMNRQACGSASVISRRLPRWTLTSSPSRVIGLPGARGTIRRTVTSYQPRL